MVAEEEDMSKAMVVELVKEDVAVQLHHVNLHWLELEMVAGEDSM